MEDSLQKIWRRSDVFIVNFEHISHLALVFLSISLKIIIGINTFPKSKNRDWPLTSLFWCFYWPISYQCFISISHCRANQYGFYMITASVMKELKQVFTHNVVINQISVIIVGLISLSVQDIGFSVQHI